MFSQNQEEVKLEWMYKGAHSTVDREEYLLGRSVDKTLERLNDEEKQQQSGGIAQPKNHVEHECIPPSIRDYKEQVGEQVDLAAKLQEDPLIAIKKREEENRRQFLNNPIQIKKLQKALKSQKKQKKKKKKKKYNSDSEEDLNVELAKKLKVLKDNTTFEQQKVAKKSKAEDNLDTILMHKYNQLKSKLSDNDIADILEGKESGTSSAGSESSDSDDEDVRKTKKKNKKYHERKFTNSSSDEDKKRIRNKTERMRSRSISSEREKYGKNKTRTVRRERSRSNSTEKEKYIRNKRKEHTQRLYVNRNKDVSYRESRNKERVYDYKDDQHSNFRKGSSRSRSYDRRDCRKEYRNYRNRRNMQRQRRSRSRSLSNERERYKKESKERELKYRSRDNKVEKGRVYKKDRKNYQHDDSRSSSSDKEEQHKRARKEKARENSKRNASSTSCSDSEDEKYKKVNEKNYRNTTISKEVDQKKRSLSPNDSSDDSDTHTLKNKSWGLVKADGTKIPLSVKYTNESSSNKHKQQKPQEELKAANVRKHKQLTEEEKEKKRREMMENAAWRDLERTKNVKQYREKEKKEAEAQKDYDPEFLHKELVKSAKTGSVESRIKANINNIQRSGNDMNKHFSKR